MKAGVAYRLRCLEARHEGKSRLIVCTAISEQHAANRGIEARAQRGGDLFVCIMSFGAPQQTTMLGSRLR